MVRTTLATQRQAAVIIQAAWRAHAQRTRFLTIRSAVVVVQAAVRMHRHRGHLQQVGGNGHVCRVCLLRSRGGVW